MRSLPLMATCVTVLSCTSDPKPAVDAMVDLPFGDGPRADLRADPDVELGDDYGLLIPSGLQACRYAFAGSFDLETIAEKVSAMARVTFRPGLYRLYKDQSSFSADLVERVEWAPAAAPGVPDQAGTFTRDGTTYSYAQTVPVGEKSMQLSFLVSFASTAGPPPQVKELSPIGVLVDGGAEGPWLDQGFDLSATLDARDLYFGLCRYDNYTCAVSTYTVEGGDTLALEACHVCGSDICKSSLGGIRRAEVKMQGQEQTLTDPLQLALAFGQHDWYGWALVRLDPSLPDGTTALLLELGANLVGQTVRLFDSSLTLTATRSVTQTETRSTW